MTKLIAVLGGGISGERKISFLTAHACSKALKKKGYKVKIIDAKGFFYNELKKIRPSAVFNAMLPVKPSVTTTLVFPSEISFPSIKP